MEFSSPRFKALTVSAGITFWFFMLTSIFGIFTLEYFAIFVAIIFPLMQFFAIKVSGALNKFAIYNTIFFLGILYVSVFSLYGILFRILRIDLLRTKEKNNSYWLDIENLSPSRIFKEY